MTFTRLTLTAVATLLALAYGSAEAAQVRAGTKTPHAASDTIRGNGGPVADTCTESTPDNPEACDIDKLVERCDAAGGGMSTLPGGGVDCDLR